jgi:hypothetical protein
MRGCIVNVILFNLAVTLLTVSLGSAQAPNSISYQGRLTDAAGQPIEIPTAVTFTIYDAATGGSSLYTQNENITPDDNGVFMVELGPIAAAVFDGSKRYLGIKVGADAEMTPRQLLTSGPYSFATNSIGTNSITTTEVANGSLYDIDMADEPGLTYAETGDPNTLVDLTGSGKVFSSVTLSAPTAGYAMVTGTAIVFVVHSVGTFDNIIMKVSKTAADVSTPSFATALVRIPDTWPSATWQYCQTISITHMFPVSAGNTTFYLNGLETSGTGNDDILAPRIMAVFIPSLYGSAPAVSVVPDNNKPDLFTVPNASSDQ